MGDISDLESIRDLLSSEYKCYPLQCCNLASSQLAGFGFEIMAGLFVDSNGIGHNHSWNVRDGKIYDITADQFCSEFPSVYVLPVDSLEAQIHYVEGVYFMI